MQNYKKQNKWVKKLTPPKWRKKRGIKKLQGVSVFSKEDGYYHGKYYGKYEECFGIAICLLFCTILIEEKNITFVERHHLNGK